MQNPTPKCVQEFQRIFNDALENVPENLIRTALEEPGNQILDSGEFLLEIYTLAQKPVNFLKRFKFEDYIKAFQKGRGKLLRCGFANTLSVMDTYKSRIRELDHQLEELRKIENEKAQIEKNEKEMMEKLNQLEILLKERETKIKMKDYQLKRKDMKMNELILENGKSKIRINELVAQNERITERNDELETRINELVAENERLTNRTDQPVVENLIREGNPLNEPNERNQRSGRTIDDVNAENQRLNNRCGELEVENQGLNERINEFDRENRERENNREIRERRASFDRCIDLLIPGGKILGCFIMIVILKNEDYVPSLISQGTSAVDKLVKLKNPEALIWNFVFKILLYAAVGVAWIILLITHSNRPSWFIKASIALLIELASESVVFIMKASFRYIDKRSRARARARARAVRARAAPEE